MFNTKYESGIVTLTPKGNSLIKSVNRLTTWDQIHYDNILQDKPRIVVPGIVDFKPDVYIAGINIATRITDFEDSGIEIIARNMIEHNPFGYPIMLKKSMVEDLTLSLYTDLINCRDTLNQIETNSNQNY